MRSARLLLLGSVLTGPLTLPGCGGGEDLSHATIPASETPTGKTMLTKPVPVKGGGAGASPTGGPTGTRKR